MHSPNETTRYSSTSRRHGWKSASTITFAVAAACLLAPQGQAQNFGIGLTNGVNDEHIDVPVTPFSVPARGITVEAWITYDDATIPTGLFRFPTIARHTDTPNAESFIFRVQAGTTAQRRLAFAHRNGQNQLQEVAYDFAPGEFADWTHVAATFDGSMSRLYVDGVEVGSAPSTGPIVDGGGTLRIGNGDISATGAEVWNGGIDELRIWPFARTEAEINESKDFSIDGIANGLTFNLDFTGIDTSQGIVGTETAGVTYIQGPPLPISSVSVGRIGVGTTNCVDDQMLADVGSRCRVGNTDFEFVFSNGPASAPGGVLFAGLAATSPLNFLGIDFYLDLNTAIPVVPATATDPFGVARLPVALSASTQPGIQLHAQAVFLSPCGTNGAVASAAIRFLAQ